jgi:Janus/Ocnus family (Ocnus)
MAIVFIDYTHLYYMAIARTGIPPARSGKFVQIRHGSTEYLVFSPKEFTKYHANIVERFCLDKGIEGGYDSGGKRYDISDRAWIVAGGGKYEIDTNKKTIKLYDNSMAYGKFDIQGLREKMLTLPELSVFTVRIE